MTDIIVRPQGPLARGSDTRATIAFRSGGSAANQAAWLAAFGVDVNFVARVGMPDVESETMRLKAAGVKPHLVGDSERETGRLVALIDPDGERSFLTDRGANEALRPGDIPDALIADAALIHLSGYSFFAPSPRAAVLDVMRRAGDKPVSVDPASAEFLREVGTENFLHWTPAPQSCSPMPRKRQFSPAPTIRKPSARGLRRSILWSLSSVARRVVKPRRARGAGEPKADKSRRSTPPARATLSSPHSSPPASPTPRCRSGWNAPSPPERSLRQSLAGDPRQSEAPPSRANGRSRGRLDPLPLLRRTEARLRLRRLGGVVDGAEWDRPDEVSGKGEPRQVALVDNARETGWAARNPVPTGV